MAKAVEKVVIGLANLVIHRVETEETTRHQRNRPDKGNQRGVPPNRKLRLSHDVIPDSANGQRLDPDLPLYRWSELHEMA